MTLHEVTIDPTKVRARLDAVVSAMKAAGAWDVERPRDEDFVDAGPFGMNKLAFEQWLRYVFVPNVEALITSNGPWPTSSSVAAHAVREWDGHPNPGEMQDALSAFDELFEPPPPPPPLPSPAAHSYQASNEAFERGDRYAALAAIHEVLAVDPTFPNAHNFAGWILSRSPAAATDLEQAVTHFRAALEIAPEDPAPLANLCNTLVAMGRKADAIAEAERATSTSSAAAAHNWLGWQLLGSPENNERAIAHFREAIQRRRWWGVANLNLAKALENADRDDEWYEQFGVALQCEDDFDRAYCHERIAAYQARRGWFRNALVHLRAAVREDDKRPNDRRALHVEALMWVEQQLRAAGGEPVPPGHEDDPAFQRARELEFPPGFLAKNEMGERLSDDVIEVERLVRAERWADAAAQLQKLATMSFNLLFDAVGYAEAGANRAYAAGARTEAIAMMKLVVDAYAYYASGASTGGEAMGRMEDVTRTRQKLASWMR